MHKVRLSVGTFPLIAAAAAITSCASGGGDKTQATAKKGDQPNILFVFVDDLGHADVGFNGSKYYETPCLDSVANQGVIFENSYSYPTSSPARTALFTGQYSFRTGVYNVPVLETAGTCKENIYSRWTVGPEFPFYSQQLAQAGYKSIHLGKWHVVGPYPDEELAAEYPFKEHLTQPNPGDYSWVARHKEDDIKLKYYPEGRGFEKNVGGSFRGDPGYEEGGYKSTTAGYKPPFSNPFIDHKPTDEWLTDRLTDEAIDFMKGHNDSPFFINLHYYTVHRPVIARSDELVKKYMKKKGDKVLGQGMGSDLKKFEAAAYASMIESVDDNFRRMVNYLKESGQYENTIIIFSSDNGYNVGSNKLMRGKKRHVYEGGIRIPTFVSWPNKVTARRTKMPISIHDYFPTFIDFAGIKDYKGTLDGTSIRPLLMADHADKFYERPIYWQLNSIGAQGTCTVMRKGDYKLIQFLATGKVELYNLEKDPMEKQNLVKKEAKKAKELLDEMVAWRKTNNVPLPQNSVVK